jgi:hypothetical protein
MAVGPGAGKYGFGAGCPGMEPPMEYPGIGPGVACGGCVAAYWACM